tara:strand:+ start:284 stop:409 length:126 start_codon:yes stop_codon:yes gene_type:complete
MEVAKIEFVKKVMEMLDEVPDDLTVWRLRNILSNLLREEEE